MEKNDIQLKQLKLMRLQTILIGALIVLMIFGAIFVAVEIRSLKSDFRKIEDKIDTINFKSFNDAIDSFNDAADKFNAIDMPGFNSTVESLKGAADNFSSVDVEKLNSLVNSLNTVATKLENAVNAINKIFGR